MTATPAQHREILDAIMRERARCARVVEKVIARLVATPPEARQPVLEILVDTAERIRRPWVDRNPRRGRIYCCGLCGAEGHTAPSCPDRNHDPSPREAA